MLRAKVFFFKAPSCVHGMPAYPNLLMLVSKVGHRVERFRIVDANFVGRERLAAFGAVEQLGENGVFVALKLIKVGKQEYLHLFEEGASSGLRRRVPVLRVHNFACMDEDLAALTHWLENPIPAGDECPYAERVSQILPADLRERCAAFQVFDPQHPFAADFEMNRRLLPLADPAFSFVDLFAGIGGFRLAMQQEGGKCVFSSEIDKNARKTYRRNFGSEAFGDITSAETKAMIPAHFDVLCAGFPCQAFSMAGLRQGFNDDRRRGMLYRQVVEIAQVHQPKAIFCENVKGLLSSAGGQALQIIVNDIQAVGYHVVFSDILNSRNYGVPQNRERLYIVALRNDLYATMVARRLEFPRFPAPIPGPHPQTIGAILEHGPVSKSYYLGQNYLNTLIAHRGRHADAGHSGFGYIVRTPNDVAGTLMCGGMGRERNMINDENQPDWTPTPRMHGGLNNRHLRFLTVREWARLQGFPDYFEVPESIQAGYKQFGNCVTVKTIRAVGRTIMNLIAQCEEEVPQ